MQLSPSLPGTLSIPELRAAIKGRVVTPDDAEYDAARTVFVGGVDRHPAVIVRVADAADVAHVIAVARATGLELAVRSGGHSNGALGVSEGGIGYLVRKFGLTIDDLLAAEVVTADGAILQVDAEHHPDLFWAIRGGGGNFGVATRFRYRLHEVPGIVGGMLLLPATPETIAGFIAAAEAAPEGLSTIANVMPAPPMPFVPEEQHGKVSIMALLCYAGDADAGQRAIAPFRALATPIADMIHLMPYPEIYPPDSDDYHPVAAVRTMFVDRIDRDVAETILEQLQASSGQMAVAQLRVLGGAMARVPVDATAFAHRKSRIMANLAALYSDPGEKERHEAWVSGFADAIRQGDDGAYVNFLGIEGDERIRAAYPGSTWDRLADIKRRYDPTNLFRLNQNIRPTPADR